MAGLGQALSGAQHAEPDMDERGGPTDGDADNAQPNVSPEDQAQYDKFMSNALSVIFPQADPNQFASGDEVASDDSSLGEPSQQIVEGLSGSENPIASLAQTLVQLISSLDVSAQKSGAQFSNDVLYHAGMDLLEVLADVAQSQKVHDFSEQEMEQAFYLALDMYKDGPGKGRIDQESAKADWDQFVQEEAAREGGGQPQPQQGMAA